MAEQERTAETHDEKLRPREPKQEAAAREAARQGTFAAPDGGPLGRPDDIPVKAMAARLGDRRFQSVQRKAMAGRIGRVTGNEYLQRVVEQAGQMRGPQLERQLEDGAETTIQTQREEKPPASRIKLPTTEIPTWTLPVGGAWEVIVEAIINRVTDTLGKRKDRGTIEGAVKSTEEEIQRHLRRLAPKIASLHREGSSAYAVVKYKIKYNVTVPPVGDERKYEGIQLLGVDVSRQPIPQKRTHTTKYYSPVWYDIHYLVTFSTLLPRSSAPKPQAPVIPGVSKATVYFGTNRYDLSPQEARKLDNLARALSHSSDRAVSIAGHASTEGTERHNQTLSENRANAVRDYLVGKGVPNARISTQGFGESRPAVAEERQESRRALNRRAEASVSQE